jgi:hypothetical protein
MLDVQLPDGPPAPDASGYCGNQFFQVVQDPPNVYFVLDRSGSMSDRDPSTHKSKYAAVRAACVALVKQLGSRANIGAAVFPGSPRTNECGAGREVFPTRPGDPPSVPQPGPITYAFTTAINVEPLGGTPVAATLEKLYPTLVALEGKTAVILATDGGPNCNGAVACAHGDCIWNIERASLFGELCNATRNCCDVDVVPSGPGNYGCLDSSATVSAVQKLRDAGIRTYVLGIPGSDFYAALLELLATVGGSAPPTAPAYYKVDDLRDLEAVLNRIGQRALLTCDFVLDDAPPDKGFVNVYLDTDLLPYGANDGWTWTSDTTLSLHGDACKRLEDGQVGHVQVVAGCPTEQPL